MKGGIYTEGKCSICGCKMRDNRKDAVSCPKHPQQRALDLSVRFRGVHKRFKGYERSSRFLTGLRYEFDCGKFDPRDYRNDNPLGFDTLARKYLEIKKGEISSYRHCKHHINIATEFFQGKNIKSIGYADLEDFLLAKTDQAKKIVGHLSAKSRANIKATLHSFWEWLRRRQIIKAGQIPDFPEIPFELGWRKVVDKETQRAIIDTVYELSKDTNIKIWIGIKWLATYISIRPKELISIKEGDFDFSLAGVFIRQPKEKKPKFIPLLDEDIELVKSFPPALPHLYFFRHEKGNGAAKPGSKMGNDYLYKYWKKACTNLGIKGVDLYGGTKHSSATALRKHYSPEQIKRATMHATSKAFERYFQVQLEDVREIYGKSSGKTLVKKSDQNTKGKLLKL